MADSNLLSYVLRGVKVEGETLADMRKQWATLTDTEKFVLREWAEAEQG